MCARVSCVCVCVCVCECVCVCGVCVCGTAYLVSIILPNYTVAVCFARCSPQLTCQRAKIEIYTIHTSLPFLHVYNMYMHGPDFKNGSGSIEKLDILPSTLLTCWLGKI